MFPNETQLKEAGYEAITECPICGEELTDCYISPDKDTVYVDFENETMYPLHITEVGVFITDINDDNLLVEDIKFDHEH